MSKSNRLHDVKIGEIESDIDLIWRVFLYNIDTNLRN